ncbi:MAG: TlyA family RNA methyltransferase [Candidatus Nomurabacteria bacterium]
MRLDQEIVKRGLCESRTEAQGLIESGNVLVNNVIVTKQTKQVNDTEEIQVTARRKFVSRGGEKLEGVMLDTVNASIKQFSILQFCFSKNTDNGNTENINAIREMIEGKTALDVGSSTGGFTDFLLSYGISHVDAVDVGSEQLHEKLRNNDRVSLFENTDIRNLKSDKKYDIIVADLSFIQLKNVLKNIVDFGKSGTCYFLLIKPQFEVGKGNTKKGIVKDSILVNEVLSEYKSLAEELGLKNIKIFPCKIEGGDGNQEYFLTGQI